MEHSRRRAGFPEPAPARGDPRHDCSTNPAVRQVKICRFRDKPSGLLQGGVRTYGQAKRRTQKAALPAKISDDSLKPYVQHSPLSNLLTTGAVSPIAAQRQGFETCITTKKQYSAICVLVRNAKNDLTKSIIFLFIAREPYAYSLRAHE